MVNDLRNREDSAASAATPDPAQGYYDREFASITNPANYQQTGTKGEASNSLPSKNEAADSTTLNGAENLFNSEDNRGSNSGGKNGFINKDRLLAFFSNNKKKSIGGAIASLLVGGGLFGATILSGPFQFIHLAQTLQRFHLTNNEEFSNDRTSKVLLYALLGNTARGRLGVTSNKAADIFEKKLVDSTGMRPVYSELTGRFVGYEIVDDNKATRTLDGASDRDTKTLERIAGKGADFKLAGELTGQQKIKGINGKEINAKNRILDLRGVSINDRRLMNNVIGRQTNTNKIASIVGSRLLSKRGGVDFHPLKNVTRNANDNLADYRQQRKDARNEQARTGRAPPPLAVEAGGNDANGDGTIDINAADQDAATKTNEKIVEIKGADSKGLTSIKAGLNVAKGPAIVVGVLCAVKGISASVDEYKFQNMQTMMRFGASFLTVGSQVMRGEDLNMDELGALHEDLQDKETGLGWDSAQSIQAEQGAPLSGPDISPDAKPSKPGDEPIVLQAVNSVPGLSPVCGVVNSVGGLPVIKQISDGISAVTDAAANTVLKQFGYTVKSLTDGAIALIAGQAVDLAATGPDLGNLANYGVRLAANDQAIANGGRALTTTEVAVLDNNQLAEPTKNIASRYFDPYVATSLSAKLIDKVPSSFAQWGTTFSKFPMSISSLPDLAVLRLNQKANAATAYDYGFPEYGYSQAERNDPKFEDPYENALIVESKLSALNEKYGECFATTVTADGTIVTGQSVSYDFLFKNPKCADGSEDLLRYRFYLADTVTAKSLACFEANDGPACDELGFNGGSATGPTPPPTTGPTSTQVVGDIGNSSDSVPCAPNTNELGIVTSQYSGAAKKEPGLLKIMLCQVSSITGTGDDASGNRISGGVVVNSRVSGAFQALGEKAKRENVNLDGDSSFRLRDSCGGSGDGRLCATPNGSMHQLGVAIDFSGPTARNTEARTCATRVRNPGNQTWDWLNKNAAAFGFKQYTVEAWHWDALQASNRCGGDGS